MQEILKAARDAGASQTFIEFIQNNPNNHKAVQRLRNYYNKNDIEHYPNSDFYAAIWNGNIELAKEHADTDNMNALNNL